MRKEYIVSKETKELVIESIVNRSVTEMKLAVILEETVGKLCPKNVVKSITKSYEKVLDISQIQSVKPIVTTLRNGEKAIKEVQFTASVNGGSLANYTIGRKFRKMAGKPILSAEKK